MVGLANINMELLNTTKLVRVLQYYAFKNSLMMADAKCLDRVQQT